MKIDCGFRISDTDKVSYGRGDIREVVGRDFREQGVNPPGHAGYGTMSSQGRRNRNHPRVDH